MTLAWLDGAYVDLDQVAMHSHGAAFRYGATVFDALRGHHDDRAGTFSVFRVSDHLARFRRNAEALDLEIVHDDEALAQALIGVVTRSAITLPSAFGIRIFAYSTGTSIRSRRTSVCIFLLDLNLVATGEDVSLRFATAPRHHDPLLPASIKTTAHYVRARAALMGASAGEDVLFYNDRRQVLETTKANIFFRHGKRIRTPPLDGSVLPGLTRQSVIQLIQSRAMGDVLIDEDPVSVDEAITADEAFVTSTSVGIVHVASLAGRDTSDRHVANAAATLLARPHALSDTAFATWWLTCELSGTW